MTTSANQITVKEIFNSIQGLNPKSSTVSSIGTFVSSMNEQLADSGRNAIMQYLPEGSLAYKIAFDANNFSTKQLWVIAYELEKNSEYCKVLAEQIEELKTRIEFQRASKSSRNSAKRAAKKERENRKKINSNLVGNVRHAHLGEGQVVRHDEDTITINFKDHGEGKLLIRYAVLETI